MAPCSGFVRMYVCTCPYGVHGPTGLDDGMYVFMYVCMCSIGWYCRNLGGWVAFMLPYICKKRILDDVMMTLL